MPCTTMCRGKLLLSQADNAAVHACSTSLDLPSAVLRLNSRMQV